MGIAGKGKGKEQGLGKQGISKGELKGGMVGTSTILCPRFNFSIGGGRMGTSAVGWFFSAAAGRYDSGGSECS